MGSIKYLTEILVATWVGRKSGSGRIFIFSAFVSASLQCPVAYFDMDFEIFFYATGIIVTI